MISWPFRIPGQRTLNNDATRRAISLGLRCAVAGVFLAAVLGKVFDFPGLLLALFRLRWLPNSLVVPAASLLLVMEGAAGLLLLSGRGARLGAALAGLMAGGFVYVTSSLLSRGTAAGCPCFGVFLQLPPWLMLGIDLFVSLACIAILGLHRGPAMTAPAPAEQVAGRAGTAGPRPPVHRRLATLLPWILSSYLVLMGIALQAGFTRDRRHAEASVAQVIRLHYGDQAPSFRLSATPRGTISLADLRGKRTLICFVHDWCGPCASALRDIAARYATWRPHLNVLVILIGQPIFTSEQGAITRFARRLRLPMTVAGDPAGKVAEAYCDHPIHTPFSILLDRRGAVRFIRDGYQEGGASLVSDVDALLQDKPLGPEEASRQAATYGRRAPDGELLVAGSWVKLSELWRGRSLLLTFVLGGCSACEQEITFLERALGRSGSIRAVYIYPDERQAAAANRGPYTHALIAADASGTVHTAYQAWNAPATFLINDGRLIYASGERSSRAELERLLRHAQSLALLDFPPSGNATTERR